MSEPQRFFEFDNFLLDSQQRMLFRDGQPVDLTPKVFDVLFELVQSGGRIIEKKELMEKIWPDSFVEEANLTQHVSTLRKKLGQDAQQRYILTVPGRGYRFVAPIKSWEDDAIVTVQERIRSTVTISELGQVLGPPTEAVVTQPRLLPAKAESGKRRTWLALISVLIILTVGVLLIARFANRSTPPFSRIKLTRFTTDGKVVCAAISPNGKQVVYAEDENGRHSLWIRQVSTSNTGVQIVESRTWRYTALTFSPDNDYVYFTAQEINAPGILYRVPALGGTPTKLIEDVDSPPTLSPDGKKIAYSRGYPDTGETAIMLANADGSGETKLASLKDPRLQLNLGTGAAWSPDGKTIVCSISEIDTEVRQEAYTINATTGELKPLTHDKWSRVLRVAWAGHAQGVLLTASDADTPATQLWFVDYPSGNARRITNDLNDYKSVTVTADASALTVVQTDEQGNIEQYDIDGTHLSQISSGNYDGLDGVSWTPDGRVLYSAKRNGLQDIWLATADGKQRKQLTDNAGQNTWPVMSPDGRTIAFASTRDGKGRLWCMDVDGANVRRLTDGDRDNYPVFSADGQWIFYEDVGVRHGQQILKVPIAGGPPIAVVTDLIPGIPSLSPDGKTLAFMFHKPALGKIKIGLIPTDLGAPLKVLETSDVPRHSQLQWTRDGQGLAYVKVAGNISNIWVRPIAGGPPRQLTNFDSDIIYNFAFSSDGRIAMSRGHQTNDVVLISSVN